MWSYHVEFSIKETNSIIGHDSIQTNCAFTSSNIPVSSRN